MRILSISCSLLALTLTVAGPAILPAQEFVFAAPQFSVPTAGAGTLIPTDFSIWQVSLPVLEVGGFGMVVLHDPAVLSATEVVPTGILASINQGTGPDFFGPELSPEGWAVGTVFDQPVGTNQLEFPVPEPVVRVFYEAAVDPPAVTDLIWADSPVCFPTYLNTLSVQWVVFSPLLLDGFVQLTPVRFLRGDCDRDGQLGLTDVFLLEFYLFLSGEVPGCLSACDTNGSDTLDLPDVIFLLNFMFLQGPPPAAPFPDCGSGIGALGCEVSGTCP